MTEKMLEGKLSLFRNSRVITKFECRCFPLVQRETSRDFLVTRFMEEMSCVFVFTFFFTVAHFHPRGRFYHRRYKISFCSSNKKCLLVFFFSRSSSFSCCASLACSVTFSFSLSFSFSIFQICGHDN